MRRQQCRHNSRRPFLIQPRHHAQHLQLGRMIQTVSGLGFIVVVPERNIQSRCFRAASAIPLHSRHESAQRSARFPRLQPQSPDTSSHRSAVQTPPPDSPRRQDAYVRPQTPASHTAPPHRSPPHRAGSWTVSWHTNLPQQCAPPPPATPHREATLTRAALRPRAAAGAPPALSVPRYSTMKSHSDLP